MELIVNNHKAVLNTKIGDFNGYKVLPTPMPLGVSEQNTHYFDFELEFKHSAIALEQLNCLPEADFPEHCQITITFDNPVYRYLDMISLLHQDKRIHYDISIIYPRADWQAPLSLDCFIQRFQSRLKRELNLTAVINLEEEYGFYLTIQSCFNPERTVATRINELSNILSQIHYLSLEHH